MCTNTGIGGFSESGGAIFPTGLCVTIELLCSPSTERAGLHSLTVGKIPTPENCGRCVG